MPFCRTLLQTASGTFFAYLQATALTSKREQPEALRQPETQLWGMSCVNG